MSSDRSSAIAADRLARIGPNVLGERRRSDAPTLLLRQIASPITAIRAHRAFPLEGWRKLDEVPYDFGRKRLSVLAETTAGPC